MSILVVGSVAMDSVKTPYGQRKDVLGGSATFFSIAASFFNKVDIIAVIGEDFPRKYLDIFRRKKIGIDGLHVTPGKTFRWEGSYAGDMNSAETIATHLNVFKDFRPDIPSRLKGSDFLFLANIDPDLQYEVLGQVKRPRLVACDSMNYWIEHKPKSFERFLDKVDILLLNDIEARQFSGEANLMKAAGKIVGRGPKAVVIKKGEHGVIYFSKKRHFIAPAYFLDTVRDPTGAGDTFAGGLVGFLSRQRKIDEAAIRKGIVYGSILASFAVEDFSVNGLLKISKADIKKRYNDFREMTRF